MNAKFNSASKKEAALAVKYANGGQFAVVALVAGDGYAESDGVVGHAGSWTGAMKVLHDKGYRIIRSGGCVSAYLGEEQGLPGEEAVLIVGVTSYTP